VNAPQSLFKRSVARLNWPGIESTLDQNGSAVLQRLFTPTQCKQMADLYHQEDLFRTRIDMARHGFGLGEYKYFNYPLPAALAELRTELYSRLAPIANRWNVLMGADEQYPASLDEYLERCHDAGQKRPTPLMLKYVQGDYNCLHQDLYGEQAFPLQVAILISRPGEDFTGGEFVMTENSSPQTRAEVVPLVQGDGVLFTVNQRPVQGKRKIRKAVMRHGVGRVRSGDRFTLGLIFHDSK
jgi:hypothetical protein